MPEVVMPRLDPGMQSGKIVEWLKKEGEVVQKGQAILVVEGEKTTFEIEAPESGILSKILANVGDDVQVADAVAIIGEPTKGSENVNQLKTAQMESVAQMPSQQPKASSSSTSTVTPERLIASPAARRLAQEHHVDLAVVRGTGPGGRITREDILAAVQQHPKSATAVTKVREPTVLTRTRLEGVRKTVAERLSFTARTAVPVIITMEADATNLVAMKEKESHIGFTAFAVKAAAKALERHSAINSSIEGDVISTYSDINVAVAINTEQGLVAPVIQNANRKSVKEINMAIEQLSQKANSRTLGVEDMTGGTFTITNLGGYDVESFAPIINPPQCAILGLGRIGFKPFAVGGNVSAKPCTLLTLVFDHRIVDGVPAAKFLQDLKRYLEDPESLLK